MSRRQCHFLIIFSFIVLARWQRVRVSIGNDAVSFVHKVGAQELDMQRTFLKAFQLEVATCVYPHFLVSVLNYIMPIRSREALRVWQFFLPSHPAREKHALNHLTCHGSRSASW